MPNYGSDFKQPPWVYGSQKEEMEWIEATHPPKKEKKKSDRISEKKFLKNVYVQLDLDVKQTIIKSSNIISGYFAKLLRLEKVEEHFEIDVLAEIFLRALAKAKFRNTEKIIVNGKIVYNHPEVVTDLRKTIEIIRNLPNIKVYGKTIEITAILYSVDKCVADIKIKKVHKIKEHSIEILMKGKIQTDLYYTFVNYLQEKLGLKKETLTNKF